MIKNIIFDWKRTLYDPDTKSLIKGALKLLKFIKSKDIVISLIGKGGEDMEEEVKRLNVRKYFSFTFFAEGDKDPSVFNKIISTNPKETVLIGDRVRSEIEIGNRLGVITIWVKQGKFAEEKPENAEQEPTYTVTVLPDCLGVIQSLE